MKRLRQFHEKKLQVPHTFDIFQQIDFYENLWNGAPSCYRDYRTTKTNVLSLKAYIDSMDKDWCLTHIDAVPDNFLFTQKPEDLRLIDWEYAGMQDPHVDIAMFCIYAMYDAEHIEQLIDAYFPEGCGSAVRTKMYCYISACGLLWSNWCEHEIRQGVEFGAYSLWQYRYAKEYYRIVQEERKKIKGV
jgi:thiamine kinase-like enzyme